MVAAALNNAGKQGSDMRGICEDLVPIYIALLKQDHLSRSL